MSQKSTVQSLQIEIDSWYDHIFKNGEIKKLRN